MEKIQNHQYGDERIVEWLREPKEWSYPRDLPYHPRSDSHGGAQSRSFVDDLMHESEAIRKAAEAGEIVYAEDFDVGDPNGLGWNVDLVMGPPAGNIQSDFDDGMATGTPGEIWLACDAKSIVTEHQKARRNRQRDINSFADIMHTHSEKAIACGILLLNNAHKFDSPTRDPDDITEHPDDIDRIVDEIVEIFDSIDRSGGEMSANLDGIGIVLTNFTNFPDEVDQTHLVTDDPAPQPGETAHYRTFVREMAELFEERFL